MTKAFYNEIDRDAAAWLEELVRRGLIAPGDVACCDVRDLKPKDLAGYSQVHLYAGIGVWSYSLRRAGIPDSANVWTFSEPCQPFSAAGKGLGFADERYLRPFTHHLVTQCRPDVCLGEQVASRDGLAWLDVVQSDMERAGYTGGAIDTCSAGFGAPHIRQRLRIAYRMADADGATRDQGCSDHGRRDQGSAPQPWPGPGGDSSARQLGNADESRLEGRGAVRQRADQCALGSNSVARLLANPHGRDARTEGLQRSGQHGFGSQDSVLGGSGHSGIGHNGGPELDRPGPVNGFWATSDWLFCRDGKWRPVEPGTFPLAHGAPARVGRLRGYGNAVDAQATTEFVKVIADVFGI